MKYAMVGLLAAVLIVIVATLKPGPTHSPAAASCPAPAATGAELEEARLARAQSSEPTMSTSWQMNAGVSHGLATPHKLGEDPEAWLDRHFAVGDSVFARAKRK
jgi:hypothetical protein